MISIGGFECRATLITGCLLLLVPSRREYKSKIVRRKKKEERRKKEEERRKKEKGRR